MSKKDNFSNENHYDVRTKLLQPHATACKLDSHRLITDVLMRRITAYNSEIITFALKVALALRTPETFELIPPSMPTQEKKSLTANTVR